MGISSGLGSSALLPAGLGFRNILINGNMVIDQRNSGASVTVNSTSNFYGPDQWQGFGQVSDGTFTMQRISATPTPPAGFTYGLKIATGTTDTSIGATQSYAVMNKMEGFNTAQLGWGVSGAKQAVLSFWVYGSKTGTYGGSLSNSAFDRSYPFTYTVNAANTWEYKTVYISGDTSGTWLKDNGIGIRLVFSIGAGTDRLATAGAWASGRYEGATGQTNLIATSDSLTFTGVQLEQNYQPTPFEQRPIGVELQLCQRYFVRLNGSEIISWLLYTRGTDARPTVHFPLPVCPRTTAANATISESGTSYVATLWTNVSSVSGITLAQLSPSSNTVSWVWTSWSSLTAEKVYVWNPNSSNVSISMEL